MLTWLWRRYALWSEARQDHPEWTLEGDTYNRVANALIQRGFLAMPISGSGYFRDYEWNWRFWRGPYWRAAQHYLERGQLER